MLSFMKTAEHRRLDDHRNRDANWKQWGPYLSERAWGTVRADYSANGDAWSYFPHGEARSRAYRWNEDGLCGVCDRNQYLCLGLALWNGRDPMLKERLFGLTGHEGNHGEDAKEYWYYLDNTPTHSYMRMLYKYPQLRFPYEHLVNVNGARNRLEPEYDLVDTGLFDDSRYFDIDVVYAKAGERDLLMEVTVHNRGEHAAPLHVLPQAWFRNTWSWGYEQGPMGDVSAMPEMVLEDGHIVCDHPVLGRYHLYAGADDDAGETVFTNNDTNVSLLFGADNPSPYVKDGFHRYICDGDREAVTDRGTKSAVVFKLEIPAGETRVVRVRLCDEPKNGSAFDDFDAVVAARQDEADAFYEAVQSPRLSADERNVQRQALAGMLWSKQLYYYDVNQWLDGDELPPPASRGSIRNDGWRHLTNFDIISMPDKWEYPWYATWDLAFHCLPLAMVDIDFAKRQLELFTREWFMHPNGQVPAYEWNLEDVNPPVHAWATWRVYKMEKRSTGSGDRSWLEGLFHKLLLNFTWWVNRKDSEGSNIFQGGFLGLDNIGLFDRSKPLPGGGRIDQSDGTSWMAAYSLQMMKIAIELARESPVYQDLATKFFEHFLRVADAMTDLGGTGTGLWDEEDGFYYDVLHIPGQADTPLKVRSLVGLLPLFAVDTIEPETLANMPVFARRMAWFTKNRPNVARNLASLTEPGSGQRYLVSLLTRERLVRVLHRMLDEEEFLSDRGIRSLSKHHEDQPFTLRIQGRDHRIGYEPGESQTGMFGGNSNWRGPVWFPINHLIIEALQRYHHYYGDDLKVECPTGSGVLMNLGEVAEELSRRLCSLFVKDEAGKRAAYAGAEPFASDPHWRDHVLFFEYFDGDTGQGLGAQHQTGWTGLVAKLLQQSGGAGRGAPPNNVESCTDTAKEAE
jgi:hypothetical protein